MSNFWTGYSNEKLVRSEMDLVKLSGLEEDEFKSYPVKFTFTEEDWKEKAEDNLEEAKIDAAGQSWTGLIEKPKPIIEDNEYIWTYEIGEDTKPRIVIIHGYGGSGLLFYKMFKKLSEHFHVYLIDLLGMGRSSRNGFSWTTYDEWEKYFVNSIEKWRQRVEIPKINFLAHSFGAFVSSKYALAYPEHVRKIGFFSPWASEATTDEQRQAFKERLNNMGFFKRMLYKVAKKSFKSGSPFGLVRGAGKLLGGLAVKKFIASRMSSIPEDEMPIFSEYMHHILMNKGCSEYSFGKMFPTLMFTEKAIANYLDEYKEHGIRISFYYGTHDWMDSNYNGKRISKQLKEKNMKVYIIQDAGHHIYFDNPEEAIEKIIEDFEYEISRKKKIKQASQKKKKSEVKE